MKIFIVKNGSDSFYNSEKYLNLLGIPFCIFRPDRESTNEEIADKILSSTNEDRIFILKENEILSSFQIEFIFSEKLFHYHAISFPIISYDYYIENDRKILVSEKNEFRPIHATQLWNMENIDKNFKVKRENRFFHKNAPREVTATLNASQFLIFQFNKINK